MSHIPTQKLSVADQEAISKLLDLTQELIELGKLDEATNFLNQIEKFNPGDLNVPLQRGMLCVKKGEFENAIAYYRIVYEKMPGFFPILNNMAVAYFRLERYDDAINFYKKALKINPTSDFTMATLAGALARRGYLDEAIEYYRRVLEISPEMTSTHSDLILTMLYAESVTPADVANEARKLGAKFAARQREAPPFENTLDTNRKLRIGYVSPDFRDHPIPYFLEPLLKNHDKKNFEIYAYSNTETENPVMERMKTYIDTWRDIWGMEEAKICDLIREDKIDILIDVTGHTAYNSLKVFAQKPAPIQATWLGYPATTGIETMDYRITDVYADPVGMTEYLNTETLWRLPHIFCCYEQHNNSPDVIDHPPFEDNGYITFGCFNNFIKVRDPVLAVWAKILDRVTNSRLYLEIKGIEEPEFLAYVQGRLKAQGIPLERAILEPRKRSNQFVLFNKIDIALDPFPCNGGTTTMDALWMGVPVITLAGRHFASRMGVTILSNAGLPELIAQDIDNYIAIASDLALDQNRLRTLRHNLRGRFAKSPAMDQVAFTHDMEESYRQMWEIYCKENSRLKSASLKN